MSWSFKQKCKKRLCRVKPYNTNLPAYNYFSDSQGLMACDNLRNLKI